ncbi:TRAP transporter small permease subunit [Maritalea mediterranea]|uniref:TRAP transporter small permease protein n=1 Tax=Maritalea mediterranea TaxID=2909667 RepID=A0ABS9EDP2_9HYPH|nr:TRAP transporter small permease subunit [Maritalea mediterranea]
MCRAISNVYVRTIVVLAVCYAIGFAVGLGFQDRAGTHAKIHAIVAGILALLVFVADTDVRRKVANFIDRVNMVIGHIMAWTALLLVLNVFLVVVLRYVFSIGEVWMQESYIWMHAFIFMLGAGYTMLHNGHVRIDLIYAGASNKYKDIINIAGTVCFGFPVLWLIYWRGFDFFDRSFSRMEGSAEVGGLPNLFILKGVIPAMALLLGLQLISMSLRAIDRLITGETVSLVNDDEEVMA